MQFIGCKQKSWLHKHHIAPVIIKYIFITVTGSHNDEEVYSYAYGDHQRHCMAEDDVYFITNDEILELRRNIKPRGNRSIKGSKSMENLVY